MDQHKQEKEGSSLSVNESCNVERGDICRSDDAVLMSGAFEMNSDQLDVDISASPASKFPASDAARQIDASPRQQQRTTRPHKQQTSPQTSHLSTIDNRIILTTITVGICCGIWYYRRFKRQQKEWQELSNVQLAKIKERSPQHVELPKESKDMRMKNDRETAKEIDLTRVDNYNRRDNISTDKGPVYMSSSSRSKDRNVCQSTDDYIYTEQLATSSSSLTNVRARQQELHEKRTAVATQQRRQQQTLRRQHLVDSLQHDAADEAFQRRKKVISQEQISKPHPSNTVVEEHQRTLLEELQEIERTALLQQQNREYAESLEQDRERSRIKSLEMNVLKKREKATKDAQYRLVRAGVKISELLNDVSEEMSSRCDCDRDPCGHAEDANQEIEMNVQVRLLLPSGQKIQTAFAESHAIGLLYDFALLLLDRENLLPTQQKDMQRKHDEVEKDTTNENNSSESSIDLVGHNSIRSEWAELFPMFSLVSTYPRVPHTDVKLTLHQSGFCQNTSLLVVIDSD